MAPQAIIKRSAPNKFSMEMTIEGMGTIMKQKFDGENGYAEAQGRKMPMSDTDLAKMKSQSIFSELNYTAEQMELVSIVQVEGEDAYKLKLIEGESESFRYYSVVNNLLLRTEETAEAQGQTMTSTTDYSDYREVEGVMFAFRTYVVNGPQKIEMNATEILINQDVSDKDFE